MRFKWLVLMICFWKYPKDYSYSRIKSKRIVPFFFKPSMMCIRWAVSISKHATGEIYRVQWVFSLNWNQFSLPKGWVSAREGVRSNETDSSPRRDTMRLLRWYEFERTRGVQVQTFHFLVSSMLINVYLNVLCSDRGQRFVQRSSDRVLRDDV